MPPEALVAYQRAELIMSQADSTCEMTWPLLAALGGVASDHGRSTARPVLRDLDGKSTADTDGGRIDRDAVHDRAVGPMLIAPATWALVSVDADGDGSRDPHDIDDAALATAVLLCSANADLGDRRQLRSALQLVNADDRFSDLVIRVEAAYRAAPPLETPATPTTGAVTTDASAAQESRPDRNGRRQRSWRAWSSVHLMTTPNEVAPPQPSAACLEGQNAPAALQCAEGFPPSSAAEDPAACPGDAAVEGAPTSDVPPGGCTDVLATPEARLQ